MKAVELTLQEPSWLPVDLAANTMWAVPPRSARPR